jgi:hypothetical protein
MNPTAMLRFLESATRLGLPVTLASLAIAAVIYWFARRNGQAPPGAAWVAIGAFSLLGVGTLGASVFALMPYHIHVKVLGPEGKLLETARVWSTAGGDPRRLADGWELDVPSSGRPQDGKLLV